MGKCKIKEVQQCGKNVTSPIIVGWDHGTLKDDLLSSTVCCVNKKSGVANQVTLSINADTIYEGQVAEKPMSRTFIAIRSKSKKKSSNSKVRLFEASRILLTEKKSDTNLNDSKFADIDNVSKFYRVFGSKKGLRQHETQQKMNIVSGNMRDGLKQTLEAVKVEKEAIPSNSSLLGIDILPPCNRNATNKEDVYNVNDIIPAYIMVELEADTKKVVKMIKANTNLSTDDYSVFFVESVTAITRSSSVKIEPDILKARIKMLIFCELLIKLVNSRYQMGRNVNFSLADNLPSTNQYILDNYTALTGGQRMLSVENQDKILCHVIILVLLSCCFVLNLKFLCSSVPFNPEKIAPMLQIVGVTTAPGVDKTYVLKTPLPALPSGLGRGRRGVKRKR